jgi:hypothetical protein
MHTFHYPDRNHALCRYLDLCLSSIKDDGTEKEMAFIRSAYDVTHDQAVAAGKELYAFADDQGGA